MSSSDELVYLSAVEQGRRIRARTLRARALTDAYLHRIEALDGTIGAYLSVCADTARKCADEIDQRLDAGETVGPLAGIPIALKDLFVTKGVATTAASQILAGWIPPYDGTVVARLKAAGAVILGKLNLDEFAMGSSNENSSVKPCKNPWDTRRTPGGSSGGSAAAVSAGLCSIALGTDTGGSIRQPAAFCGTVGIKPTYGRVSRYGVIAFASSLDQVGPLARTVEDAALALETVAGFDPLDATSIDTPVPAYAARLAESMQNRGDSRQAEGSPSVEDALPDLTGVSIGLPEEYFSQHIDMEVSSAVEAAIQVLEQRGAVTKRISLPHTRYALPAYYLVAPAEASSNLARYDGIRYGSRQTSANNSLSDLYCRSRGLGFGPEVKRRIMLGTYALRSGYYDAYYVKAQKVRSLIKQDFDAAFSTVDVILSPTSPTPAFALGEKTANPLDMYQADVFTLSCNLAGLPGLSVPCGFTKSNLPIGLQLLGQPLAEQTILRVAHAYERSTPWSTRHPNLPGGCQ